MKTYLGDIKHILSLSGDKRKASRQQPQFVMIILTCLWSFFLLCLVCGVRGVLKSIQESCLLSGNLALKALVHLEHGQNNVDLPISLRARTDNLEKWNVYCREKHNRYFMQELLWVLLYIISLFTVCDQKSSVDDIPKSSIMTIISCW